MRNIRLGKWLTVDSQEEHYKILSFGEGKTGEYEGPGKYLFLNWKACSMPTGYHEVYELIPRTKALKELEDEVDSIHKLIKEGIRGIMG